MTAKPRIPAWFSVLTVLVTAVLMVGAFFLGQRIGSTADLSPSPSTSASSDTAFQLPRRVLEFSLDESPDPSVSPQTKDVLQGKYVQKKRQLMLLVKKDSRGLEKTMAAFGINNAAPDTQPNILCGISADTQKPACGRESKGIIYIFVAKTDFSSDEVAKLVDAIRND